MLVRLLHRLVAIPKVYDLSQFIAGASVVKATLRPVYKAHIPENSDVLDIGGGTGLNLSYISAACNYTCLDNDSQKLEGFQAKYPGLNSVLGDAAGTPFPDSHFDVVLMTFVAHHLPEEVLKASFAEITRILKSGGRFIFTEPLLEPSVLRSRLLWKVDRGASPRTHAVLRKHAETHFEICEETRWAVHHRYVCWVMKPKR